MTRVNYGEASRLTSGVDDCIFAISSFFVIGFLLFDLRSFKDKDWWIHPVEVFPKFKGVFTAKAQRSRRGAKLYTAGHKGLRFRIVLL